VDFVAGVGFRFICMWISTFRRWISWISIISHLRKLDFVDFADFDRMQNLLQIRWGMGIRFRARLSLSEQHLY